MIGATVLLSFYLAAQVPATPGAPFEPTPPAAEAVPPPPDGPDRDDAEALDCDGSTLDMVECITKRQSEWDRRLNGAYVEIADTLSKERRIEFRDVQRLWIRYRDASCGFYAGGEGSIARIEAATCLLALTSDRAREFERNLQAY